MKMKMLMDSSSIDRSLTRMSHEILEENNNSIDIVLVGIHNRGVPLSYRIQEKILELCKNKPLIGSLDITFHRDDFRERLIMPKIKNTNIPFSIDGKTVVLVDDVLYTGRTIRAALDELNSFGRASKIQLAIMVDRGHRELPIEANFIGKNIPTHEGEHVNVFLKETDSEEGVYLLREENVITK